MPGSRPERTAVSVDAIQHIGRTAGQRHAVNLKTVGRKRRTSASDRHIRKDPKSIMSIEDEAIIVAFRRYHAAAAGRSPLRLAGHDPHLTHSSAVVCNATGSARLRPRAASQSGSSRPIRSATSTSISPKCNRR
jgi:hypothetical protein